MARRLLQQILLAGLGRCPAGSALRGEAVELVTAYLAEHSALLATSAEPLDLAHTLAAPPGHQQFAAFLRSLGSALAALQG